MSETALSAIAEINPGARIPKEITGSDEVSFIPMSDVSESGDWVTQQTRPLRMVTAGFTAFEEGDVLVAKITPCLENGKGAHARGLRNGIGFGSTEFHVLRAKQGVEPRFVFHITQSRRFRQAAERQMVGSAGQQRVQRQFFDEFLVRDFSPCEQRVIAQILDTLDTAIRETEALIDKLKAVKQGLLHDLLTRGIDANGQLRPPQSEAPQLYKESPLGWIPREWEVRPAESVCEAVIDCKNRTPPIVESGHPVVRTPNVRDGRFVYTELVFTDEASYKIWTQRGRPRPGDVLITREAPVGEVCLVPADMQGACLGQRMMMYQPDPSLLRSDFMLVALMSQPVQRVLIDKAGGSTVGHVRVGDIRRLAMPVPSLPEQALIVDQYQAAVDRLGAEESTLVKLRDSKSGLMDDLLTGRMRVTPLLEASS